MDVNACGSVKRASDRGAWRRCSLGTVGAIAGKLGREEWAWRLARAGRAAGRCAKSRIAAEAWFARFATTAVAAMMSTMPRRDPEKIQAAFASAQGNWRAAIEAHRLAPPDAGFSARVAALAAAALEEAEMCLEADQAGFEWPPHRGANAEPPCELRPGSNRRGPEDLWERFDQDVAELNRAAAGRDLEAVADRYRQLGDTAAALASAIETLDRKSGLLAPGRQRRARRSA